MDCWGLVVGGSDIIRCLLLVRMEMRRGRMEPYPSKRMILQIRLTHWRVMVVNILWIHALKTESQLIRWVFDHSIKSAFNCEQTWIKTEVSIYFEGISSAYLTECAFFQPKRKESMNKRLEESNSYFNREGLHQIRGQLADRADGLEGRVEWRNHSLDCQRIC